jgi:hypothetical protein
MKKKFIEDIKPLSREARKGDEPVKRQSSTRAPRIVLPREIPYEPSDEKPSLRYTLWYVAVICIVVLLFSISYLFESASVSVSPKLMKVPFDASDIFTASKDTTDTTMISYTIMSLNGSETVKLPSTESKILADHASGTALVYNTYSKGTISLPKNTALQTSDGRVYLTGKAVVIPGYVMADKTVLPGTVEVPATAVLSAESGNLDGGDFFFPKYLKLPQDKKVYAKVKKPFVGGSSGKVFTISKNSADAAYATLNDKLKSSLTAKAKVQVPDGYLYYDGGAVMIPDKQVQVSYSKEKDVPVVLTGTLYVYLIKKDSLISAIAKQSISQYNNEAISMPNLGSITLTPKSASTLAPMTDETFQFTFSGSVDIIWSINKSDVQKVLVSRKKADFEGLVGSLPGVEKAQVVIRPFWARSFPKGTDKIDVTITAPIAQ